MKSTNEAQNEKIKKPKSYLDSDRHYQVFGGKHMIWISSSETKGEALCPEVKPTTVVLDFSPRVAKGQENIDWKSRISVHLTLDELFDLCSLMALIRVSVDFDFRGPLSDQFLNVRWKRDGSIVFTCDEGSGSTRKSYSVELQKKSIRYRSLMSVYMHYLQRCTLDEMS